LREARKWCAAEKLRTEGNTLDDSLLSRPHDNRERETGVKGAPGNVDDPANNILALDRKKKLKNSENSRISLEETNRPKPSRPTRRRPREKTCISKGRQRRFLHGRLQASGNRRSAEEGTTRNSRSYGAKHGKGKGSSTSSKRRRPLLFRKGISKGPGETAGL